MVAVISSAAVALDWPIRVSSPTFSLMPATVACCSSMAVAIAPISLSVSATPSAISCILPLTSRAIAAAGPDAPDVVLIAQVTIETTGSMLLGSEIGAALTALEPLGIDVIGLNCATGPAEMSEHIRHLSHHSRRPIAVLPNMGLPSVVDGKMHYDLTPEEFVDFQTRFVTELGVQVVGGCCGSTADHISQLAAVAKDLTPAPRNVDHQDGATSIFGFINSWNELVYAVMFITSPGLQTLPVGLASLVDENRQQYGVLLAIAVLALIPSLCLFGYIQRYLTTGLTAGAVKG